MFILVHVLVFILVIVSLLLPVATSNAIVIMPVLVMSTTIFHYASVLVHYSLPAVSGLQLEAGNACRLHANPAIGVVHT